MSIGSMYIIFSMALELSRFEYVQLDNDGETIRLEKWAKKRANVFYGCGDEVKKKYQYLVP